MLETTTGALTDDAISTSASAGQCCQAEIEFLLETVWRLPIGDAGLLCAFQ